jgi:hypothetical protein
MNSSVSLRSTSSYVRSGAAQRLVLVHRRDVHDPPATAARDHPAGRDLGAQERPREVDLEGASPARERVVEQRRAVVRAGVVDEDVDPAEAPGHGLDHRADGVRVAQVGPDHDVPAAVQRRGHGLRLLGVAPVMHRDAVAVRRERARDRRADPPRGARHEHRAPFALVRHGRDAMRRRSGPISALTSVDM